MLICHSRQEIEESHFIRFESKAVLVLQFCNYIILETALISVFEIYTFVYLSFCPGTEVDTSDEYGLTPLLWACAYGQLITVKYLLDLNVSLDTIGPHGENALLYVCCYGYTEILGLLLQLGMDVDYMDEVSEGSHTRHRRILLSHANLFYTPRN